MPTTGILPGDVFLIYVDGTAVSAQTAGDVNQGHSGQRNISNKQSGDYEESRPQRKNATISGTSLVEFAATHGWEELQALFDNDTLFEVKVSTEVEGDHRWTAAEAYFDTLNLSFPDQDNVEMTYDIIITGSFGTEDVPAPV